MGLPTLGSPQAEIVAPGGNDAVWPRVWLFGTQVQERPARAARRIEQDTCRHDRGVPARTGAVTGQGIGDGALTDTHALPCIHLLISPPIQQERSIRAGGVTLIGLNPTLKTPATK